MKQKASSPDLKKQIQAAQEFLSNLKTESQVALQRRNQIQLDTQAETDKLLAKRKSALEVIETQSQKVIEDTQDQVQALKNQIGNLEFNRDSLDTEIQGKITQLNNLHNEIGDVKTQIEAEKSKATQLQSEQLGIQSSIDSLKEQTTPLQLALGEMKHEISGLEVKRADLTALVETKTQEYTVLLEESERDLSILKDQKVQIKTEIQDAQADFKRERDDLATRKLAADKRDDNLRAREYKVNRDEAMIEQNAGLLNL